MTTGPATDPNNVPATDPTAVRRPTERNDR